MKVIFTIQTNKSGYIQNCKSSW